MDKLHMKAVDCEYKEYDRRLTEQLINGLDNEVIMEKKIRELTALKHTSEVNVGTDWRLRGPKGF